MGIITGTLLVWFGFFFGIYVIRLFKDIKVIILVSGLIALSLLLTLASITDAHKPKTKSYAITNVGVFNKNGYHCDPFKHLVSYSSPCQLRDKSGNLISCYVDQIKIPNVDAFDYKKYLQDNYNVKIN